MSFGAIFLLREPVLRGFAFVVGLIFIAIAVGIWFLHPWEPDESRGILLLPLTWGILLFVSPLFFRGDSLRAALVIVVAGLPMALSAVGWFVCRFGFLSPAACG